MNSTSNSSLIVYQSVKDRALYLLKEEKVNEKEILSCSQDLLAIPNLNEKGIFSISILPIFIFLLSSSNFCLLLMLLSWKRSFTF